MGGLPWIKNQAQEGRFRRDSVRQYPRTKFAEENEVITQVEHIRSELWEFIAERIILSNTKDPKAMIREAHDIIQSAHTLMDILEREYPGQAWSALDDMIKKNYDRGYYPNLDWELV